MANIKATKTERKEVFNSNFRKEKAGLYKGYKVLTKEFTEVVDCRIYYPGTVAYSCVWVKSNKWASGTGKAGGYGYHKTSQAAANAIRNAGFDLSEDIGGRGDSAIEEALLAVAESVTGFKVEDLHIVEMYG